MPRASQRNEILVPGNVLRWAPEEHHCRQGTAIVLDDQRAYDTFWSNGYSDDIVRGNNCHVLSEKELATAEVVANLNDFGKIGTDDCAGNRRCHTEWATYHPIDRLRIGNQHQYGATYYRRKGAVPDLWTQIKNAQAKVEDAEGDLSTAQWRLERAREDLAKLEAAS